MVIDVHFTLHIIEVLTIAYIIISHHQTKQMLVHLAKAIMSVNKHLDTLIDLSELEVKKVKHALKEDFKEDNKEL